MSGPIGSYWWHRATLGVLGVATEQLSNSARGAVSCSACATPGVLVLPAAVLTARQCKSALNPAVFLAQQVRYACSTAKALTTSPPNAPASCTAALFCIAGLVTGKGWFFHECNAGFVLVAVLMPAARLRIG